MSWQPPPEGWCKLNCNGSFPSFYQIATTWDILMDNRGRFLMGFSSFLGTCMITHEELNVILKGLQLVKSKGLVKILVEFDSKTAIKFLSKGCPLNHHVVHVVDSIWRLIFADMEVRLFHWFREMNVVVDSFVNHAKSLARGCIIVPLILFLCCYWLMSQV